MLKVKTILIIVLVIITLGIAWKYYKKYRDQEKLKIGEISLTPQKEIKSFDDLVYVFKNGLKLKGFVQIRNFSGQDYSLNQISIDSYSPETEKLIAEQTNILQSDIVLKAKQSTIIPLEYNVDIINALSLFKESKVIPADYTVWKIITHPLQAYKDIKLSNLKMKLKGFIQAEGINMPVDELNYLYG